MIPKFRCWFKPENTMREVTTMEFTDNKLDYICFDYEETGYGPDKCILMQFTGLFDKNGVEIFEGDVVKFEVPETTYTREGFYTDWMETSGIIVFNHSIGMYLIDYGYFKDYEMRNIVKLGQKIEVIGNIYENPELVPHA